MARKIVRIGVHAGEITGVSRERINYVDEDGRSGYVDLIGANRRMLLISRQGSWPLRVGFRELCGVPPWVEFPGELSIRFTFASSEDAYSTLVNKLSDVGWCTFDMA